MQPLESPKPVRPVLSPLKLLTPTMSYKESSVAGLGRISRKETNVRRWVSEDLRVRYYDDSAPEYVDGAVGKVYRPVLRRTTSKPLNELATTTGKDVADSETSDLYTTNGAPPWNVLRRFPACRLLDPHNRNTRYWLPDDVPFNTEWVQSMRQSHMISDDDVFLWVHSKAADQVGEPLQLQMADNDTRHDFVIVSPEDGSELPARALVVFNSNAIPSYSRSRRSGFIILRHLETGFMKA